jgi:hypothetical protein
MPTAQGLVLVLTLVSAVEKLLFLRARKLLGYEADGFDPR